jgi:pseudaminic acid synthase
MNNIIDLNGRLIGKKKLPYIVAEMSGNHNEDIKNAFKIIETAKKCGADAVKIQTYTPDTMTIDTDDPMFIINSEGNPWKGRTMYDLYKEAMTPWEWHEDLFNYAKKIGITIFSTPFDLTAVDFLESIDCPAYKIASFELVDLELISAVSETKKPVIMSTGMATKNEIADAVDVAKSSGCIKLILLKCTSSYPATPDMANLCTIKDLECHFNTLVGISDHTIENVVPLIATALGSVMIEKHLTTSRKEGGVDSSFSLEPVEFENMVKDVKVGFQSLGEIKYGGVIDEEKYKLHRRSLYFSNDMKEGDIISRESIKSLRPSYGISPKFLKLIIGKKLNKNIKKNQPVQLEYINEQ